MVTLVEANMLLPTNKLLKVLLKMLMIEPKLPLIPALKSSPKTCTGVMSDIMLSEISTEAE